MLFVAGFKRGVPYAMHIYIYTTYRGRERVSTHMYMYVYMYVHACMYIYIYVYIPYIYIGPCMCAHGGDSSMHMLPSIGPDVQGRYCPT